MNLQPEPMTHAERLLWLAELEDSCRALPTFKNGPDDQPHLLGCECSGTGRLPRFPTLRGECSGAIQSYTDNTLREIEAGAWHEGRWHPKAPRGRCLCRGRGWVPVDDLEATLGAVEEPHYWEFHYLAPGHHEVFLVTKHGTYGSGRTGAFNNKAAISALYKCRIAETKP